MADLAQVESPAALETTEAHALAALRADAMPKTTRATYKSHCKSFARWCASKKLVCCPAEAMTLARYVLYLEEEKPAQDGSKGQKLPTIQAALAAIHWGHSKNGEPSARHDELVKEALRGVMRRQAGRPLRKMAALTPDLLLKLLDTLPQNLTGIRDRALLLVGFGMADRRSELVAIEREHITFQGDDATIVIAKSKTDQEGRGFTVPIYRARDERYLKLCPVGALRAWLDASRIESGPVFRKIDFWGNIGTRALEPKALYSLVKTASKAAGLDQKQYGGHSLRAGFITYAAKRGVPLEKIARTSRHKNLSTLMGYVRDVDALKNGAGKGLL